ncbi:hypothetical protein TNCV_2397821 [Trichonephila clavipes]|uniref:Uncharacterized protein n=1 Tax=Trichonephila clavipes TaxID=2585209 RepID=A0A8X6SRC5_TRICX|nr:hypothetical protein TNCV_2397821 [Trichonephila clavipes]
MDAGSENEDESEMNNTALVPMSSEMRNIRKTVLPSRVQLLDHHFGDRQIMSNERRMTSGDLGMRDISTLHERLRGPYKERLQTPRGPRTTVLEETVKTCELNYMRSAAGGVIVFMG